MSSAIADPRLDPPSLEIVHGPWSLSISDDEIVDVAWNGTRIVSGIRAVVRDPDWLTVLTNVSSCDAASESDLTTFSMHIETVDPQIDYSMVLEATVSDTRIDIRFTGRANVALRCNRIGFVVLHPVELSGSRVQIDHTSGSTTTSVFPELISPHQPFVDIAGMRWEVGTARATLEFEGDVFETEDQRNWTDASYKTYSRPLALPFPYALEEGDVIEQRLVLTMEGSEPLPKPSRVAHADRVVVGRTTKGVVPALGTSARLPSDYGDTGSAVRLPFLIAEVDVADPTWYAALDLAISDADQIGAKIDLRLILSDPDDGPQVLERLADVALERIAVFDRASHVTEPDLWRWLTALPSTGREMADLVAGTRAHFTELNRSHDRIEATLSGADGVTFSVTPTMHSTQIRHIVSSLGAQEDVAKSAGAIALSIPMHIGPITLESRFNAVATTAGGASATLTPDPLTRTPFAAAWAVGSIAALSGQGVASLGYFRLSELDDSEAGSLLVELADSAGSPIYEVIRDEDGSLVTLAVGTESGIRVFVGNLDESSRRLVVEGPAGDCHSLVVPPWSHDAVLCAAVR